MGTTYTPLSADEEFQAGYAPCDVAPDRHASHARRAYLSARHPAHFKPAAAFPRLAPSDNDHNPPRIAPRSLFDVSLGKNNIFNKEHFKTDLDLTAINVTNKYALYNFLSTFSGTHYVTPRAMTAKITFNF